ncbi:MAG TPA: MerR family transcriptional regulator, partial [Acidimicrobiales bacterium]|nr:MerR family transcriptional regulator [Acidimicrobiales bacterium]
MDYRVEELARRADTSVDTIRYYQAKGLLPPPRREGRVAWYEEAHLERLARIRSLAARGLTLATIGRLLEGELDAADEALAAAVASPAGGVELLTLEELAERTSIPLALLQAVSREGLLVARRQDGQSWFTTEDVAIAAAGLKLLEAGLPLPEVLDLARRHDAAMRDVAERAVALFDDHIRQPLRTSGLDDDDAAGRLVEAFQALLPATVALVTHHFRRTLLAVAQQHIESVGGGAELEAVEAEARSW